jgi:hypothetical protein
MNDQHKILDDTKRFYDKTSVNYLDDAKLSETDQLKRRIKDLESKLKIQKPAERPYESPSNVIALNVQKKFRKQDFILIVF